MDVDLDAEQYRNCREAGRILAQVRDEAAARTEIGTGYLEISEWAEARIRELGDERGVPAEPAFPVNVSVDNEAAHGAAAPDDDRTIGEQMVKLDIGVHVDGWLADTAVTIDFTGTTDMVEAASEALDAAVALVEPGVHTGTIGAAIEEVIDGYGYNPVVNLTGHGLGHWEQHTSPNVPNRGIDSGVELAAGDVIAIEPFVTDGSGKVSEGAETQIYALEQERSVRDRAARQALDQITESYRTLPFAVRWLDGSRASMAVRRLERAGVIHGYPVLKEAEGTLVSQREHTLIVTENGCEVTTRSR